MELIGCDGDWIVPEVEEKEFARALWKVESARDGEKEIARALWGGMVPEVEKKEVERAL